MKITLVLLFVYTLAFCLPAYTHPVQMANDDAHSSVYHSMLELTDSEWNEKEVKGNMEIKGQKYEAICDCSDQGGAGAETVKCDPSKIKLRKDKEGSGTSIDAIRELIGYPSDLQFIPVERTSFKCLDGRVNGPLLGTPGGDAGEFILGLVVYQDLTGRDLTDEEVKIYFQKYLDSMEAGKFYMCTDDLAVAHIEKTLSLEGLNIFKPKTKQQEEKVLEIIERPENIGDTHIRMMMKYADKFSINKDLVKNFLISFYSLLWDESHPLHSKLELDVLGGDHNESGFVEIRSDEACLNDKIAPLIKAKDTNKQLQVFINHIDAVTIRRGQIAKFFSGKLHHDDSHDAAGMEKRLEHHGLAFLELTGSYIAKDLPFYTASLV